MRDGLAGGAQLQPHRGKLRSAVGCAVRFLLILLSLFATVGFKVQRNATNAAVDTSDMVASPLRGRCRLTVAFLSPAESECTYGVGRHAKV